MCRHRCINARMYVGTHSFSSSDMAFSTGVETLSTSAAPALFPTTTDSFAAAVTTMVPPFSKMTGSGARVADAIAANANIQRLALPPRHSARAPYSLSAAHGRERERGALILRSLFRLSVQVRLLSSPLTAPQGTIISSASARRVHSQPCLTCCTLAKAIGRLRSTAGGAVRARVLFRAEVCFLL